MGPTVRWNSAQEKVFEWWKCPYNSTLPLEFSSVKTNLCWGEGEEEIEKKRVGQHVAFKLLKWPPRSWHMAASWLSGQIASCTVLLWMHFIPCTVLLWMHFVPCTVLLWMHFIPCTVLLWMLFVPVLSCCECTLYPLLSCCECTLYLYCPVVNALCILYCPVVNAVCTCTLSWGDPIRLTRH